MYVLANVMAGFDSDAVFFINTQIQAEVRDELIAAESSVMSEIREAIGHQPPRLFVDVAGGPLWDVLQRGRLATRAPGKESDPVWLGDCRPLRELVLTLTAGFALPRGIFWCTAEEYLYLGNAVPFSKILSAARFFIGGLTPVGRRRAYGYLTLAGRPTVWGDVPSVAHQQALLHQPRRSAGVYAGTFEGVSSVPAIHSVNGILRVGRCQVVQTLSVESLDVAHRRFFQATTTYASPHLGLIETMPCIAGGMSEDHGEAITRGAAEAVERFCSGDLRSGAITRSRGRDLDGRFLDPRCVIEYSRDQYRLHSDLVRFDADEELAWVTARDMRGNQSYVPADLVFYPYSAPTNDGRVLTQASSSGVAAAPTLEEAQTHAYLELVERDAFMRAWLGSRPGQILRVQELSDLGAHALVEEMTAQGWKVQVQMLPSATAHVAMAIAISERGVVVGLAAGTTAVIVKKALTEAFLGTLDSDTTSLAAPSDVLRPLDHRRYWRGRPPVQLPILADEGRQSSPDFSNELDIPVEALFILLSRRDVTALSVVRCICPGLIPISFGWNREPLGLKSVREICGPTLSLIPHPFA